MILRPPTSTLFPYTTLFRSKDLKHKMYSIKLTTKTDIDITKFIQEILSTFESTYSLYLNDGFSEIKLKWESYGFRIGEPVFIKTLKREWRAVFHGIAADGALLVKNSDGMTEKLYSDRKSTRLNSSHVAISYAVFCLKKKKTIRTINDTCRCYIY